MDMITANLAIYGLFGIALVLITRHHNRTMDRKWAKWDAQWAERSKNCRTDEKEEANTDG